MTEFVQSCPKMLEKQKSQNPATLLVTVILLANIDIINSVIQVRTDHGLVVKIRCPMRS